MHPRDDRAQGVDLREKVDVEMSLPGVDAQLRARDLARGLQDGGVQDNAVDVSVGLAYGRNGSLESSSISAESKRVV